MTQTLFAAGHPNVHANAPRMRSGARGLRRYDLAREGEALAAARPAAERRISAGRAGGAIARRRPDIALPKSIADTNDHESSDYS